jgi:hypothetical protein
MEGLCASPTTESNFGRESTMVPKFAAGMHVRRLARRYQAESEVGWAGSDYQMWEIESW